MDYTARLMRRTLVCAAFSCALAAVSFGAAIALQGALSLLSHALLYPAPPLWASKRRGFSRGPGRVIFTYCAGALAGAALYVCTRGLPYPRAAGVLCMLTAALCQCALLYRVKKTGRPHYAACLIALPLILIACTR